MDRVPKFLLGIVAASVMLLFVGGVLLAAHYSIWTDPPTPDKMPTIATYVVSTVNGILAANLGAILGVSAFRGSFGRTLNQVEKLQWTAAIFYVLMIIAVVVIWGKAEFTEESVKIVSVIPEVGRTGLGLLFAVFAAALGVQITAMGRRVREE